VETLKEARPTCLIGVPRVWEKMAEKMQSASKHNGPIKKWISSRAQDVGLRTNLNHMKGYNFLADETWSRPPL
jgi:long-chain-fatty-acid--CoA ligase ACSBG